MLDFGTSGNDNLLGTDGDDTLLGDTGDDTINGGLGDDLISGEAGNDSLVGGEGYDGIFGGLGNDTLIGNNNFTDEIFHENRNVISDSEIQDLLAGDEGDDTYILSLTGSRGTAILDLSADTDISTSGNNDVFILSENTDENVPIGSDDPSLWGNAFIELSEFSSDVIGIFQAGTSLSIDINQSGQFEEDIDILILDYFIEDGTTGNLTAGVQYNINNLDQTDVVNFFNGDISTDSNTEDNSIDSSTSESSSSDINESNTEGTEDLTVYRFFNPTAGVHFYTADENEREFIESELDNVYDYEGPSYNTLDPLTGNPVYRFFNSETGVHLYTTDENERDFIQDNLDIFSFEGTAFNAYETQVDGSIPIYRFFNTTSGAHFYTPSADERDNVEDNLPDFQSEGIAYYALPLSEEL